MVTRGKAISSVDLAYTAGILDGEGHVGIDKSSTNPQRRISPRYEVQVSIVNTCKPLIDWLQEMYGGSVNTRPQVKPHHKITYRWKISEGQAAWFLSMLVPYLREKRQRAELVVEFVSKKAQPESNGYRYVVPPAELERRERIYQQLRKLTDDRHPQRLSERAPESDTEG